MIMIMIMKERRMIPLIISRLIEKGCRIYIPLHKSFSIIIKDPNGELKTCELQNASQDTDRAPVARELRESTADLLGVADPLTKTVWIIPKEAFEGRRSVRLGRRYEEYIIPEPLSLSYQEQKEKRKEILSTLKETARALGERK